MKPLVVFLLGAWAATFLVALIGIIDVYLLKQPKVRAAQPLTLYMTWSAFELAILLLGVFVGWWLFK